MRLSPVFFFAFGLSFRGSRSAANSSPVTPSEVEELLSPILQSSQPQKVMILRRSPSSDGDKPADAQAERAPEKTMAQREKEYQEARERIFKDAAGGKKQTGSGKKKGKR